LAIATAEARLARPLATLERINRNEDMRRLRELAREHSVKQIVVGLPLNMDGTRGAMADEAERFAQRARKQIGIPVEMLDERLTSWKRNACSKKNSAGNITTSPTKKRRWRRQTDGGFGRRSSHPPRIPGKN